MMIHHDSYLSKGGWNHQSVSCSIPNLQGLVTAKQLAKLVNDIVWLDYGFKVLSWTMDNCVCYIYNYIYYIYISVCKGMIGDDISDISENIYI